VGAVAGASTAFTALVSCTDGFTTTVALDTGTAGVASTVVRPIATGATCTVTEPAQPAGWQLEGISPNPVVVGPDPTNPAVVTITDQRRTGRIDIVKQVVGPIAGAPQDFTVDLDCPGDTFDTDVTLRVPDSGDAAAATVGGIPTGMQCTLAEDGPPPGWSLTSITPDPVTVGDEPATVTLVNTRRTGSLTVTKRIEGDPAGASTTFDLHASCPGAGLEQDISLDVTNGTAASRTLTGIPTGVTCTVTEDQTPAGWALDSITPGSAVVGSGPPVEVVATNVRQTGGITVTKTLSGPVDGASTHFSAFLDCDGTRYDQQLSADITSGTTRTVTVTGIPTGTSCAFTEVNIPPQWQLGGVASNIVSITTTDPVLVNAVNVRRTGDLHVVKAVAGDPPDHEVSFDLRLDCSDNVFDTLVPVNLAATSHQVAENFSGIPTGVTCRVTERALPNGWELASITPASVTVGPAPVVVTVANQRSASPTPTPSTSTSTPSPSSPTTSAGGNTGSGNTGGGPGEQTSSASPGGALAFTGLQAVLLMLVLAGGLLALGLTALAAGRVVRKHDGAP
jgi:hypothetical protein